MKPNGLQVSFNKSGAVASDVKISARPYLRESSGNESSSIQFIPARPFLRIHLAALP
jgi:hypothetical protein